MTLSHWSHYYAHWARLGPPLRPTADVVAAVRGRLADHPGPTLLLGVTPELADIASNVTSVDRNEDMIRALWPGDTARRRSVKADWLDLPFPEASFTAVVGDGCLNVLSGPAQIRRLFDELARVVRPGGPVAFRVFRRPGECETPGAALTDALAGKIRSFHAFKWRFVMALVAESSTPSIAVQDVYDALAARVPDRAELARRAGWDRADVDTIDVYRNSPEIYCFPTAAELLELVPISLATPQFVPAGSYELADRCPLMLTKRMPAHPSR